MKGHKNWLLLWGMIFLCLVSAGLTGCHGAKGTKAFEMPEAFDEEKQYEISFWAKNDTNKVQTEVYKQAISDFEKQYPNIKVNMRLYTNYQDIYHDVITNIATKTTPNVCISYPDHVVTYMLGSNVVAPLEELMTDREYGLGGDRLRFQGVRQEEIVEEYLKEGMLSGDQYMLPFMRSSEACYINKDYVEKLGYEIPDVLTWDYILEVSRAALEKGTDGNYLLNGQKTLIPFIYKSTDNMLIQLLRQKGVPYSNEEGDILLFHDVTKEILKNVAENTKRGAFSTFKMSGYPANYLNAGQCIFAIDSTAGATWMGCNAPLLDVSEEKLVQFETVVRQVPQVDTSHPQMISQGPSLCLFNKEDPNEVVASWLFMQYLLTNQVQIAYSMTEGYVPVTYSAREDEDYLAYLSRAGEDNQLHYQVKMDVTKMLLEHTSDTFVTPVFNGSASLRMACEQMVENVVKSVKRRAVVDDAYLDLLFSDMNAMYKLDQNRQLQENDMKQTHLPIVSLCLLVVLAVVWICIIGYVLISYFRRKKNLY